MTLNDRNNDDSGDNLVLFPAEFRIRCPRCGAAPQASPFAESQVRYSCRSRDDFQSTICMEWEKEGISEGLVADAREILSNREILHKFQFGFTAAMRAVR